MAERIENQGNKAPYVVELSAREFILSYNKKIFSTIMEKPKMREYIKPHISPDLFTYDTILLDNVLEGDTDRYTFYYRTKNKDIKRLSMVKNPQYQGTNHELYGFDWAFAAIADSEEDEELLQYIDGQDNNKIYCNDEVSFIQAHNVLSEITLFDIKTIGAAQ